MSSRVLQKRFLWAFIISLIVFTSTYFYKDKLPPQRFYDLNLLKPPSQTETSRERFSMLMNQQEYTIFPKFDYELTGVVVTYNDADQFTNIWHHRRWKDFINVRDLCVVWEPNISSGAYQKVQFSSDSWTCWYAWEGENPRFSEIAISNNHLVTNNRLIKKALFQAEKGDLIQFKGMLAEYKNVGTGALRQTSTRRDDRGNGACETVYLQDFTILKKANVGLRRMNMLAKWVALISFIGFIFATIFSPFRSRDF